MIKVFLEYKVIEEYRESYLEVMRQWDRNIPQDVTVLNYHFYEGADQPLLFVEMFDVESLEQYQMIKRQRCDQKTLIEPFIEGGRKKIHMWAFREIEQ
jgi:hypothetical protein